MRKPLFRINSARDNYSYCSWIVFAFVGLFIVEFLGCSGRLRLALRSFQERGERVDRWFVPSSVARWLVSCW